MLAVAIVAGQGALARAPSHTGSEQGGSGRGAAELAQLIEAVPSAATGHVSYNTTDSLGEEMGVIDPIPDPAGGYLAVYDTPFGSPPGATGADFRVSLAHSSDLIHWIRVAVLDPAGAAMPTLRRIPGTRKYLLAYEKQLAPNSIVVRLRYYSSLTRLLMGRFSDQRDLPRRYSSYANGTPDFNSIAWHGALDCSVVTLGFHYNTTTPGRAGPDREARGVLHGFRRWTTRRDNTIDRTLRHAGFLGSHRDRREFSFKGHVWRIYEAQTATGDFATWHLVLYDPASHKLTPLSLTISGRRASTSFGNPTVAVEPAPSRSGRVLVITAFVFSAGQAASDAGELVYYKPL